MKKTCSITKKAFEVVDGEIDVLRKMGLKDPLFSPVVREVMRFAFRNERNLKMRKCDATGETILSIYGEDAVFPVYKYDYWVSDKWDVPEKDFDFDKSFFEQYSDLSKITPRAHGFVPYNENCDYVSAAEKNKNCYMHILSDRDEDCMYTHGVFGSKDCIDCSFLSDSELCYECTDCRSLYHCKMCFLCDNSSELNFCFDMRGCQNCFFCSGLRNQKYCYFNEQLSREEYEGKMEFINLKSYKGFEEFRIKFIEEIVERSKYERMINAENCTGNFLVNTKNCFNCFDVENAEDCSYLRIGANGLKDVHHSHAIVDGSELIVGNVSTTESYNCHNVIGCWTCNECSYSEFLQGCKNCIGCISLRRKQYCVFNKQYSKDEYEKIKRHIIDELGDMWGSPFPLKLAPFNYQESAFKDYSSLTEEEVKSIGWEYGKTEESKKNDGLSVNLIPDIIDDFEESSFSNVYECPETFKLFKIIKQEFLLLRKIGVPLPRKHHEARFRNRMKFRKAMTVS